MAIPTVTDNELLEAFDLLLGAGLAYAPGLEMVELTVKTWQKLLADLPQGVVITAAREIALRGERFPSVSEMRKRAEALAHSPGRFEDARGIEAEEPDPYPFIAVVTREGWERWSPGRMRDGSRGGARYPAEVAAEIERLAAKYQDVALPSDSELAYLDTLIEIYGGAA